ncbi:hypothetical protein SAMN05421747_102327 [Parapedobacter composti]|uniref:Uncharacterized protein n=1 Tax=Parapedobacter composti TaxID=623281 RepID=A0A1I1F9Q5_9SPHI|nr:hypothetical protein [Parapedobacter composti]SFB96021.1 hypothetical protein SAMN05421747_102327 [Parapedobacter composti]
MNLKDLKHLNSLLADFTWYGRTFLQTGTGLEWDAIGGRDYFATAWMEFFKGINDGTYHRLAEAITDAPYIPHFRGEVQKELNPLLAELEAMAVEQGLHKIKVRIDVGKFKRYETKLRQLSADGIVFDIIQDDDDIRDTYFIDGDPDQIRSYLMHGIKGVIHRYTSAEQEKIRGLEIRLKELETELQEKNGLLNTRDLMYQDLARTVKEQQEEITAITERNRTLEGILSEYSKEEEEATIAEIEPSAPIKDGKLRMYFLYKLGFLDKTIWNDGIKYKHMATILRKILCGEMITQVSALRYAKLFNSTGSTELKHFESENESTVLDYLKSVCPDMDFPKGRFVNDIRKNTGRSG